MKKVAFLIPNLLRGGSERVVSRLSIKLQNEYEIYLILFNGSEIAYDYGGTVIDLSIPSDRNLVRKILNVFLRIRSLKKAIEMNEIEIVFSFTSNANLVNSLTKGPWKKLISCRGFGDLRSYIWSYHLQLMLCNGLVFNSQGMRDFYLCKYPLDSKKTYHLYNMLDLEEIKSLSSEPIDILFSDFIKCRKVIITVSHFSPTKGHWNLLKSFEILKETVKDAGLVFIGNRGTLEDAIKDMAQRSKYRNDILFLGFQKNPFKYVAKARIFALSSLTEGFPNSIIEAMACNVPVVTTNCKTGPAEILSEDYIENFTIDKPTLMKYGVLAPEFDDKIDFDFEQMNESHFQFAKALSILLLDEKLHTSYSKLSGEKALMFSDEKLSQSFNYIFSNIK